MSTRVLIIGGYGNFGSYIVKELIREDFELIIIGRSQEKFDKFIRTIDAPEKPIEFEEADINIAFPLEKIKPDIVIHTSGPFQEKGYDIARACIDFGCHYIDLSDGRDFVANISELNDDAVNAGVSVISGASSVPCLSAAVIEKYKPDFAQLETVEYAITTAQQTNRGLATTASILGYTGKPISTLIQGKKKDVYGWQDLHFHKFPVFGYRALSNCDVPDLELFPKYFPDIKTIRFYAGTEIKFMHIGLWLLSWFVRFKIIKSLRPAAGFFLKIANMFDWLGSSNSAFLMKLSGKNNDDQHKEKTIYILAREGDGPFIPCAPAIILARKLAKNNNLKAGAMPCIGLIDLDTYMAELDKLHIELLKF